MPTDTLTEAQKLQIHRSQAFSRLGFTDSQSQALSYAKDFKGFPLSHHDACTYLAQGADHEQIVRIFST